KARAAAFTPCAKSARGAKRRPPAELVSPGNDSSPGMIKAVIFDFGGVLCFHPDEARWSRLAETAGMPVSPFMSAFWAHRINYDAGQLEPAEYWRGVLGPAFSESKLPELIRGEIELWN